MNISGEDSNCSPELKRAVGAGRAGAYYFQDGLLRPDDVFLASYPRSGNHFLRFIVLCARHYEEYGVFLDNFSGMTSIPDIHNGDVHLATGNPRIIKTHFPFDPRYKNVIHLVRDPRDVAVSYFHYARSLPNLFFEPVSKNVKLSQFIGLFSSGKIWPCDYGFHWDSYSGRRTNINYIRISYELLLHDTINEVTRLLQFLSLDLSRDVITRLCQHTSFEKMTGMHNSVTARMGHVSADRKYMMRKGVSGIYKEVLNKPMIARIEKAFGKYILD